MKLTETSVSWLASGSMWLDDSDFSLDGQWSSSFRLLPPPTRSHSIQRDRCPLTFVNFLKMRITLWPAKRYTIHVRVKGHGRTYTINILHDLFQNISILWTNFSVDLTSVQIYLGGQTEKVILILYEHSFTSPQFWVMFSMRYNIVNLVLKVKDYNMNKL